MGNLDYRTRLAFIQATRRAYRHEQSFARIYQVRLFEPPKHRFGTCEGRDHATLEDDMRKDKMASCPTPR